MLFRISRAALINSYFVNNSCYESIRTSCQKHKQICVCSKSKKLDFTIFDFGSILFIFYIYIYIFFFELNTKIGNPRPLQHYKVGLSWFDVNTWLPQGKVAYNVSVPKSYLSDNREYTAL